MVVLDKRPLFFTMIKIDVKPFYEHYHPFIGIMVEEWKSFSSSMFQVDVGKKR